MGLAGSPSYELGVNRFLQVTPAFQKFVASKLDNLLAEPPADSEFLSFFVLYSRLLADFLSHLGKWVKLIKFEAENEFFCTWKVEKPQNTTPTP